MTTSPDGTVITPMSGGTLTDVNGIVWAIVNNEMTANGAGAFNGIGVLQMTIMNGVIWGQSVNPPSMLREPIQWRMKLTSSVPTLTVAGSPS